MVTDLIPISTTFLAAPRARHKHTVAPYHRAPSQPACAAPHRRASPDGASPRTNFDADSLQARDEHVALLDALEDGGVARAVERVDESRVAVLEREFLSVSHDLPDQSPAVSGDASPARFPCVFLLPFFERRSSSSFDFC